MKFCIVAFITIAAAVPPPKFKSHAGPEPALLESKPLANLTIVLKKKKLMPVPCRLPGGTFVFSLPLFVYDYARMFGSASEGDVAWEYPSTQPHDGSVSSLDIFPC
ncbi:hypothetical protein E4U47_007724 [Claviceps purpurea]|nr:hypothetical protein E4U47_007724 [Claviceps purpurea]